MTTAGAGNLIDRIRFPEPVAIREVWPTEPVDFTPWLAANLGVLDALGLGQLILVDTEVPIPGTDRALDILAETPSGERVAIENQYGRADHDHLTRGLAYAVGLQAEARKPDPSPGDQLPVGDLDGAPAQGARQAPAMAVEEAAGRLRPA